MANLFFIESFPWQIGDKLLKENLKDKFYTGDSDQIMPRGEEGERTEIHFPAKGRL